ncbi:cytidine deaminase [bacterium (candidate division B38) B3_B38]|nr:MAG: cytidine deaminase [bacterium (candidate division B38) B3_B38]
MAKPKKPDNRPSWDDYFMEITELVSRRSTCLRRQVGAVIVKGKRILTTGYNGAPSGLKHCSEVGCLREKLNIPSGERQELCRASHAEQNAIIQAAQHGVRINEATIYSTHFPCVTCAKMIINAGIKKIIYQQGYPDQLSKELLQEARIELIKMTPAKLTLAADEPKESG